MLLDSSIAGNEAGYGSGIYSRGALVVESCSVTGNGNTHNSVEGGGINGGGTVRWSTISGNNAYRGGGILGPCMVEDSLVEGNGGADCAAYAPAATGGATLVRCTVRGHNAGGCYIGSPLDGVKLIDSYIVDNSSQSAHGGRGGAMENSTATRCRFEGNRATGDFTTRGGAIVASTAIDCTFVNNWTGQSLAGPASTESYSGTAEGSVLQGCLIMGSRAQAGAVAVDCLMDRCTVLGSDENGVLSLLADCTVTNSILWDDTSGLLANTTVNHSLINIAPSVAATLGTGNITALPRFWSESLPDLRLRPDSPCIDAGDPSVITPDGSRVDMGAHQYDPLYVPAPLPYCEPKTDQLGCTPAITASAMPSLTGGPVTITATGTAGAQFGLLFLGGLAADQPYFGGTLCVAGPLTRSDVIAASGTFGLCDGELSFPFTPADLTAMGFAPGESIHAQCFYRAGAGPLVGALGLSAGVELVLFP